VESGADFCWATVGELKVACNKSSMAENFKKFMASLFDSCCQK